MKQLWIYLLVITGLLACRTTGKPEEETKATVPYQQLPLFPKGWVVDTVILKNKDTAFVAKQEPIVDDIGDKRKEYPIRVAFANKQWPVLNFNKAIGADLYMVGDLDGDNSPELLLRPEWFSSCWASLNLYSLKSNKWQLVKKGSIYFCSDQYPLSKRIIKTGKGYSMLVDSLAEDKFITIKKEIKF